MGKREGFDVVADAQEVAEHNINPYYWVNRVTSFTFARWMVQKKLAIIFAPLYVVAFILIVWNLSNAFRDGYGFLEIGQIVLLGFFTVVEVIMAVQWWRSRGQKRMESDFHPKRKRQPRRRKDYH